MPEIPTSDNIDSGVDGNTAEEDSDEYEDAIEMQNINMDLHHALRDCNTAIQKFFNNDIIGAQRIMTPWKRQSLYHSHGATIFQFIPALLTLDPLHIQKAREASEQTLELYNRDRRTSTLKQTLSSFVKKPNYAMYNDMEAHAELIYAECQLIVAAVGALESEDMGGILRASMRIRNAFTSYKHCSKLLAEKQWENDLSRWHFASGVNLGLATYNIIIAMLPPKIIYMLEFVGFTANREKGLRDLEEASDSPGLRNVICRMMLLIYHLVISHYADIPPNIAVAEKILKSSLELYPDSVWFLLFKGRLELLTGCIARSRITYGIVADTPYVWEQIQHLAYWEIMWEKIMMLKWERGVQFAEILVVKSRWSLTICMYMQAIMIKEMANRQDIEQLANADRLFLLAPTLRRHIMGRSIPMEKFIAHRCERYFRRGTLILPAIEMLYLFNYFPSVAKDRDSADEILKLLERTFRRIENDHLPTHKPILNEIKPDNDDRALVRFLRGALLAALNLPGLALNYLQSVMNFKYFIKDNKYLLPYSMVESAMCHYHIGNTKLAVDMLNDARRKYSGYILDSKLHFRIHAKLSLIKASPEFDGPSTSGA